MGRVRLAVSSSPEWSLATSNTFGQATPLHNRPLAAQAMAAILSRMVGFSYAASSLP